jgi:hypothetical protein
VRNKANRLSVAGSRWSAERRIMRNKPNCPECPKMGAGRKAGNGTWRSQRCQTNPIAKGYPGIPRFHHSSIPGLRLRYKQSQLGRFAGWKWQVARRQSPAAGPTGLPASRRNALRRHYEQGCAAPNEANSARGDARPPGPPCETEPIWGASGHRARPDRTKRTQFGERRRGAPTRSVAFGDPRSPYLEPSCETKPIWESLKLEGASFKQAEYEAKSSWAFHFARNALRRHYEHGYAAPNEANWRAGTLALLGHRAKRSQLPRGRHEQ